MVWRNGTPALWRVLAGSRVTEMATEQLAGRIRKDSGEKTVALETRFDVA